MASIKVKYRPSTASGKEGSIYYQVIHGRIVRQVKTDYRIFDTEWDKRTSSMKILSEIGETGNGTSVKWRNVLTGTPDG